MKKAYTRKGDQGTTRDFQGVSYKKSDCFISSVGKIDSLQASVDQAIYDQRGNQAYLQPLLSIQEKLWQIAGEIASASDKYLVKKLSQQDIVCLEKKIDDLGEPPKTFVRFTTQESIHLNECRVRCRDLERKLIELKEQREIKPEILAYTNRLSSLFYMMAYKANKK